MTNGRWFTHFSIVFLNDPIVAGGCKLRNIMSLYFHAALYTGSYF